MMGIDVSFDKQQAAKAAMLRGNKPAKIALVAQAEQLKNPDCRITFDEASSMPPLAIMAQSLQGSTSGDNPRFVVCFWECPSILPEWEAFRTPPDNDAVFGGSHSLLRWEKGAGELARSPAARIQGDAAFGQRGVLVSQMSGLRVSHYFGEMFDMNGAVIVPRSDDVLPALWCYCTAPEFQTAVRRIDQALKVTNATFAKVPFDLAHWQKVASAKYPSGLPKPFSTDPTQWLFNGHPKGSDRPLQVAVARLLGYQWPRQTGSSFPDCPAVGTDGLEEFADGDGIVCLSATMGKAPASERLRELLARAWDKDWSATVQEDLLAQVDYAGETLDDWLRDAFFDQHCALFHQRPFIWHIWDGHKSGFSALVNYHQLTHANLEKLTYAYLGDWVRRQQAAVDAGEAGSDARLQSAKQLQSTLKLILEGEPPYDVFVRWKPLSKQTIGWRPDINDGVRMNIRPFAAADILRKRVKIKWGKDRGKEPARDKKDFPWFWGWDEEKQDFPGTGKEPDGNRWNDCHYSIEFKKRAREANKAR